MAVASLNGSGARVGPSDVSPMVIPRPNAVLIRLLGLPFAVVGGVILFLLPDDAPPVLKYAIGSLFLTCGLGLLLHISRCVLDPVRGTIEITRGVVAPLWRRVIPLDVIDHVEIVAYQASSGSGSRTQYGVMVVPPDASDGLRPTFRRCFVFSSGGYPAARQWGERIAAVVRRPLVDRTGATTSVRQPEELDVPVAELWRREGVPEQLEAPPADAGLQHQLERDRVVIDLPKTGVRGPAVVLAIGLAGVLSVPAIMYFFIFSSDLPVAGKVLFGLFLIIPELIVATLLAWFAAGRTRLECSPDGVTITRRLGPVTRRQRFTAQELEEVLVREVPPNAPPLAAAFGNSLVLRSDTQTAQIGWGLRPTALRWIRDALRWALTRGAPSVRRD